MRELKCTVVIAVSHMNEDQDCALSRELGEDIDLIVGGHDHLSLYMTRCGKYYYQFAMLYIYYIS